MKRIIAVILSISMTLGTASVCAAAPQKSINEIPYEQREFTFDEAELSALITEFEQACKMAQ